MLKRLMNVITVIAIPLFIIVAYGSRECESCEKPLSILMACVAAIFIEVVINYVVFNKLTLWHKN